MSQETEHHVFERRRGVVIARVISVKGHCTYGLKVGDSFKFSAQSTGKLCGDFYHNLYPYILTYQFGATFPEKWGGNRMEFTCPDIVNQVRIQLRPEGVDEARHPIYLKEQAV